MEADFKFIRQQIGDDKTLGASANTFADIQRIAASGAVDYIGCGPFSDTQTKPNDFPLLGYEGYTQIILQMKNNGIDIPVLAVGGVEIESTEALLNTGVYGIAVSAAVNMAESPETAIEDFRKLLY